MGAGFCAFALVATVAAMPLVTTVAPRPRGTAPTVVAICLRKMRR
jgi:hypothetical protein